MRQYKTLVFEKAQSVAVITLNRPDAANGLNTAMAGELV
ncbi:MAG: enoyl-CoA hydratase/isomerase family protein, partial [Aestuariibacter sp.]|nr:enoyl-CoA hydratase/isomerase family protein [Aestuariibacter sp.]